MNSVASSGCSGSSVPSSNAAVSSSFGGGRLSRRASGDTELDVAYSTKRDFDNQAGGNLTRQIIEQDLPTMVACSIWV